jgi:hypothetical protein
MADQGVRFSLKRCFTRTHHGPQFDSHEADEACTPERHRSCASEVTAIMLIPKPDFRSAT